LNKYITSTNRFVRFSDLTPEKIVRDIYESPNGTLWIGSSDGLLRADISDRTKPVQFVNVSGKSIYLDEDLQLLSHQKRIVSVVSVNQISPDTLLIGAELGMFLYLPQKNQFVRFDVGDANDFIVTSILITQDKTIWVGSFNGLIKASRVSPHSGLYTLTTFSTRGQGKYHLFSNRIESLVQDPFGNIWAGTRGGGLVRIDRNDALVCYMNNENDINSIRDNMTTQAYFGSAQKARDATHSIFSARNSCTSEAYPVIRTASAMHW
jgi:ligand-binding sensor domain-containing protein